MSMNQHNGKENNDGQTKSIYKYIIFGIVILFIIAAIISFLLMKDKFIGLISTKFNETISTNASITSNQDNNSVIKTENLKNSVIIHSTDNFFSNLFKYVFNIFRRIIFFWR